MNQTFLVHIKNMVCPRCIDSVREIFSDLNIETMQVALGEVTTTSSISADKKQALKLKLSARGFELLEDKNSKIIAQIKAIVVEQIHYNKEPLTINFSTLLSDKLNQDYTSLSKLFSSLEGFTVEKYILKQKIEKVKELIIYNELNLSEIAFHLNYSSVAHLSSQFKKETGMTPSTFKKLKNRDRKTLDSI
jgi:AraC family transcriptional regulator